LKFRYLGHYALCSGPCVNAAATHDFAGVAGCLNALTVPGPVDGRGFGELTLDAHSAPRSGWGPRSASTTYAIPTRRRHSSGTSTDCVSEIDRYPNGRADSHQHPLEPLMGAPVDTASVRIVRRAQLR
jgi:hypothetical protein